MVIRTYQYNSVGNGSRAHHIMETEEVWKYIDGTKNYFVSNKGRVKHDDIFLKHQRDQYGYMRAHISYKNGARRNKQIHRLVMLAFAANHPKHQNKVHHKNNKRDDNRLENLEWVTTKENNKHQKRSNNAACSKPIVQYDLKDNKIKSWPSITAAARSLGFSQTSISSCCAGSRKTSNGFIWKYKKEKHIDGEIWKKMKYNSVKFKVSSKGRIETPDGRTTFGHKKGNYMSITICGTGFRVHRLVCRAFHPNPENKPEVDHINRDTIDNDMLNLRWASPKENSKNKDHKNINYGRHAVVQLDLETDEIVNIFKSIIDAARDINGSASGISQCCRYETTWYKGYCWRFANLFL